LDFTPYFSVPPFSPAEISLLEKKHVIKKIETKLKINDLNILLLINTLSSLFYYLFLDFKPLTYITIKHISLSIKTVLIRTNLKAFLN